MKIEPEYFDEGGNPINTTLPTDSESRKDHPIFRGVVRYFPAALAGVAKVSKVGNDKHNPGQEMHHSRGKSSDHADCIVRHLIDMSENGGIDPVTGLAQVDYVAWRALAMAQEWHETHGGAPLAAGARQAPVDSDAVEEFDAEAVLRKIARVQAEDNF